MRYYNILMCLSLACAMLALGGCARAAVDTTGYAAQQSGSLDAPFEESWQATKTVLREEGLELYTRDKRGVFVAYTDKKRRMFQPHRVAYRIELAEVSKNETRIFVEAVRQVYGVTLLTYPGWHDRPMDEEQAAAHVIAGVQAKLSGVPPAPPVDDAPVELSPAEPAPPAEAEQIEPVIEDAETVDAPA